MTEGILHEIALRQRKNRDAVALLWEIHRLRETLLSLERSRRVVQKAWREEVGGHLVALHDMRLKLQNEPVVVEARSKEGRLVADD